LGIRKKKCAFLKRKQKKSKTSSQKESRFFFGLSVYNVDNFEEMILFNKKEKGEKEEKKKKKKE